MIWVGDNIDQILNKLIKYAVARSLVEGLIAVFPTAGEDLSNALLSVAGTGVGAISEFANMLIPLGGTLYDNFQGLANDLRAGTITMEDVPSAIASIVDSSAMNVEELDRLRVIAGLEGHRLPSTSGRTGKRSISWTSVH